MTRMMSNKYFVDVGILFVVVYAIKPAGPDDTEGFV